MGPKPMGPASLVVWVPLGRVGMALEYPRVWAPMGRLPRAARRALRAPRLIGLTGSNAMKINKNI